jgi:cell division protein ZapA (FtsZ GTPase activity inhibitor)
VSAVKVQIMGTDYWLNTSGQEERLQIVAASLDEKLKEVLAASKNLPILSATVLVALNLTNELLQLQETQEKMLQDFENHLDAVLGKLNQM